MDNLETKIIEAFEGKVVRKDLAFEVKGGLPVPTYVLEYLLGQYCASNDELIIREGVEKVKDIIRNNYINRAESEEVKGKIRELIANEVEFQVKVLRNGTEDRFESEMFNNGDDLYLSFTSPVAGYLAIYLVDVGNDATCILPYQRQQDGIYAVKANQRYVFFSEKDATPVEKPLVDSYNLTALYPVEQNQIYVVFSTQSFVKAADNGFEGQLRQLKGDDFQKWLAKCRKRDMNMTVKMIPITIQK